MVARQLAEAIIAVDNGPVHDLSVPQNKVGVCSEANGAVVGRGVENRKKGAKEAANDWRRISFTTAKDENVKKTKQNWQTLLKELRHTATKQM